MGRVKILKASAGSGKTYRLAYEYIRSVIDSPQLYRHILAVTFTNKATEEMKQRIVGELNALANGSPSGYMGDLERDLGLDGQTIRRRAADARTKILHDYSRFTVLTIDKFFQRIIRSFIKELGIDLNFNLELQTDSILDSATDRLIDRIAVDRALRDWVLHFVEEKIDTDGRWDIRGEISQLGRELFGERYRAVSGDKASREELSRIVSAAVARSRRIENEMKKTAAEALAVIDSAGLAAEDFAYGRGGCVGYFVKTADGTIAPYGKRVLDALESEEKWVTARSSRKEAARSVVPTLRRLLAKLCSIYDDNIRFLNTARLLSANYRSFALLDDLSEKVAEICTEQNLVPISETNAILGKLMGDNDAPFIYEKVGNTFSRFMIDEFQDTSQGQWSNFVPLLENAVAQSEDEPVLLVGDVKQSIYRWRGGDWRILGRQVASRFKDTRTASLDTNYRSEKTVVEFNNSLIEACVQLDNDRLNRMIQEAAENGRLSPGRRDELSDMLSEAYRDQRQRCSKTREAGYVTVREYEKGEQPDPPLLIRTVEDLQSRGFAAGDIAVLVRTNPQGAAVAQQLLDYKSTHPESPYCYDVVTQEALQIGHSDTAGFIASVFRLAAGSDEPVKRAVYNLYLGNPVEQPLTESEQAFIESLGLMSIEEAFEETVLHYRLNEKVRDIAYIQAMQEQVHAFSTSRIADLPLFLKWWDETGAAQSISLPRNRNAITVITIHKAKGLQYKAVVLPDCDWSLQPKTGSLIWGRTDEKPFDSLKHMPLRRGILYRNGLLAHRQHQPILRGRDEGRAGTAHPDSPRRQRDAADRQPGHERDPMRGRRKRRNRRNEGKRRPRRCGTLFSLRNSGTAVAYGASGAGTRRLLSYPANRCAAENPARLATLFRGRRRSRATLSAQLRHSDAQTARERGRQTADRPAARSHAGRRSRIAKRSGKNPGTAVRGLFRSDRRIVVRRQMERRAQRTRHRRPGRAIDPPARPRADQRSGSRCHRLQVRSQKTQPAYPSSRGVHATARANGLPDGQRLSVVCRTETSGKRRIRITPAQAGMAPRFTRSQPGTRTEMPNRTQSVRSIPLF